MSDARAEKVIAEIESLNMICDDRQAVYEIIRRHFAEADPQLARVAVAWPSLPDHVKALIVEMLPRECVP